MTATKKQYTTERVTKDDGTSVSVCRCALADMDTLMELQDRLVEAYIQADGAIGEMLPKEEVQSDLRSICALLPLEQRTKSGDTNYLAYDDICENWEQLVALFFNGSINTQTREVTQVSPSRISQLHFLPFEKMVRKHVKTVKEKEEKEKD